MVLSPKPGYQMSVRIITRPDICNIPTGFAWFVDKDRFGSVEE